MRTAAILSLTTAVLVTGCGGNRSHGIAGTSATRTRSCVAGSVHRVGSRALAYAAVVRSRATVVRRPGGRALSTFDRLNENGVPTVFEVLAVRVDRGCRPVLYRVQVPLRPNGITGWVAPAAVTVETVRTRIDVDLSQKRLVLFQGGREVLHATVAIGATSTPTPTGRYYVNQRLIPGDPSGPFGPGAVGISAFSNVLTGWAQGGPIAIHGTNEPWSIGRAVSNGCIRLPNPVLRRVFAQALAGTPVVITK
jgi:lipoprotein-anchoring transpeptidase ErfK/SrfK